MFYLSRAEQAVLFLLIVLLLTGAGVLTYARGQHAAGPAADQPLFVPAPSATDAASPAQRAPAVDTPGRRTNAPMTRREPTHGTPIKPRRGSTAAPRPGLLSLNTASQQELETLPGIGPVLAQRIIDYRGQRMRAGRRGFESKDDLLNVPGIGPKRYTAIRDLVTL